MYSITSTHFRFEHLWTFLLSTSEVYSEILWVSTYYWLPFKRKECARRQNESAQNPHYRLFLCRATMGPPNISFKVQWGGMSPILIDCHLLTGTFATLAFNLSPLQFFSALQCAFSKYTMHLYQIVCSTYIAIFACFLFCLWILCLIGLDFECCILSMTIKMSGKCRESIMESSWCDWLDLQDKWCHCKRQQNSSH